MVGDDDSTVHEGCFLERCRFRRHAPRQCLASLVEGVILSWGWRRRAIAFVSGAVGALALPPFSLFALIALPLTVAVWLIDGAQDRRLGSVRAAFGAGWWMGFGYFLAGLWWVGAAFLVEADKFAWALPLGVVALPAVLAVFPAAGFAIARLLWSPGPARVFALAFGLGLAEWARGLLFTGFPWNDLGMALGSNLALAQIASLVGLHGLTFLTIAIFAAPATLWRVGEGRLNLAPAGLAALALALSPPSAPSGLPRRPAPCCRASSSASSSPMSPRTSRSRPKTRTRSCAATSSCRSARPPRIDPGFAMSPT